MKLFCFSFISDVTTV